MKRFFFSVIALAAVVVGCTKSGLVEVPQSFETPINFEPYTGKAPTTKATIMDEAALKADMVTLKGGFHVSAFTRTGEGEGAVVNYTTPYMNEDVWWAAASSENTGSDNENGDQVDGEGAAGSGDQTPVTEGSWDYEGKAYWPEGALDFVAYGLNAERHMEFDAASPHKVFTYTVPTLVSDQEDLIVSLPQPGMTNNNGNAINLPFYHLLSKIGFSLQTNDDPENVDVIIKKIELKGNFYSTGSVDLTKTKDFGATGNPDHRPYIDVPESQVADVDSYSFFGTLKTDDETGNSTVIYYDDETPGAYDCFVVAAGDAMEATPIYASNTLTVSAINEEGNLPSYRQDPSPKQGATPANRYMMIIPCTPGSTQSPATISVTYQITGDMERTAEAQLAGDFTFDAGMGYEFVLKVSTLRVDFSVKVDDYTNGTVEDSYTLTPVIPEDEDTPDQGAGE